MRIFYKILLVAVFLAPVQYSYAAILFNNGWTGTNADELVGDSGTNQREPASCFTATQSGTVSAIGSRVSRSVGRTQDGHLTLWNYSAGYPTTEIADGTDISIGVTYPTYTFATSTFSSGSITAGTTYCVSYQSASLDGTKYLEISGNGIVGGNCVNWNGTNWTGTACNSVTPLVFTIEGTPSGGGGSSSSATSTEDLVNAWNHIYIGVYITFLLSLIGTIGIWYKLMR